MATRNSTAAEAAQSAKNLRRSRHSAHSPQPSSHVTSSDSAPPAPSRAGTPEQAIQELRESIWDGLSILECVAEALDRHFGSWPRGVPNFAQAIRRATAIIDKADSAVGAELDA